MHSGGYTTPPARVRERNGASEGEACKRSDEDVCFVFLHCQNCRVSHTPCERCAPRSARGERRFLRQDVADVARARTCENDPDNDPEKSNGTPKDLHHEDFHEKLPVLRIGQRARASDCPHANPVPIGVPSRDHRLFSRKSHAHDTCTRVHTRIQSQGHRCTVHTKNVNTIGGDELPSAGKRETEPVRRARFPGGGRARARPWSPHE